MKRSCLAVLGLSLISGRALANPIESVARLSVEATGNTHVLVRFTSNSWDPPKDLTTFGTSHSDWFETGQGVSQDLGSGVIQRMVFHYLCDCHVPTGSPLTYTSARLSGYMAMTVTLTPTPGYLGMCEEKCAEADQADAGQATATGGTSGNASSGSDASTANGGTSGSSGAAGGNPSAESARAAYDDAHSACSFSPHGRASALSLLLALGLVALSWRRRR